MSDKIITRNADFVSQFGAENHDAFKGLYPAFNLGAKLEEVRRGDRSEVKFYPIKTRVEGHTLIATGRCTMHGMKVDGEMVGFAGFAVELNKCFYWKVGVPR